MKKFLLAVKAWIVAHKVIAIAIAGGLALALTVAIVVPVSVSASKKKKAAQHDSQQPSGDQTPSGDQGGEQGGGDKTPAKTYTITWKDENGTVLETDYEVPAGTVPTYDGTLPTKAETDAATYVFNSWSPAVVAANADAEYIATYSSTTKKYTIKWVDGNGDTLKTDEVEYGQVPVYTGENPTKDSTVEEEYTWNSGWDVTPVEVTGNATYTATFDSAPRKYTITWVDGNGDTLKTEQVAYGTLPVYSGETPEKDTTMENTYVFNDTWSPAVQTVSGDATYTANFDENGHSYHVTYVNYNGDLLQDMGNVAYSDLGDLNYTGDTPLKPQDEQYSYAWDTSNKWTQNIDVENSTVTYTANFTNTLRTYTVTWVDGNGHIIGYSNDVAYGTTPEYPFSTPTKDQTSTVSYTFNGTWTPALGNITGDTEFTANFDEGPALYEVRFLNSNGTVLQTFDDVAYNDPEAINLYEGTPTCQDDSNLNFEFDGWVEQDPDTSGFVRYFKATYHAVSTKPEALSYTFDTDHYIVTDFKDHYSKLLTIPSVYDDGANGEHPVTAIGDNAFGWCSDIEKVTIPASVTSIGDFAFGGNTNLVTVEIEGNPTFKPYAFSQCAKLDTLTMDLFLVELQDALHLDFQQFQDVVLRHLTNHTGVVGRQAFVDMLANLVDVGRLLKLTVLIDALFNEDLL